MIARTTTTRVAPAASTSSSRSRLIPPIANQGRAGPSFATCDKRSSPAAGRPGFVGVVLGLLYLFPIVATVIPDHVLARHLEQIAPMTVGLYIQATTGLRSLPLTPWQGLGVLALWSLGAMLLGALVLRFRDA